LQQPGSKYCHVAWQDGFIHLTADPSLLLEVANRFYTNSSGDWEVLVIDPAKLSAEVKIFDLRLADDETLFALQNNG
jgi:uncharacterized protein (DUF952 family)